MESALSTISKGKLPVWAKVEKEISKEIIAIKVNLKILILYILIIFN
jgi:hypothetical protein